MDELRGLVSEGYGVFHRAADAELSWTDFDAALHEWQESASALRSHALATAFATPFDEVSLTEPVTVECGDDV
jgi:hypothetical protein